MVEGIELFDETIEYLKHLAPMKPFEWDESLALSAQEHVDDIGPKGLLLYQSSDGTDPEDRIGKYGTFTESLGENIDFGPRDALGVIVSLTLDDGEKHRPHRGNLFKANHKKIGIACGQHKSEFQMCVLDFANDFKPLNSKTLRTKNKAESNINNKSKQRISNPKEEKIKQSVSIPKEEEAKQSFVKSKVANSVKDKSTYEHEDVHEHEHNNDLENHHDHDANPNEINTKVEEYLSHPINQDQPQITKTSKVLKSSSNPSPQLEIKPNTTRTSHSQKGTTNSVIELPVENFSELANEIVHLANEKKILSKTVEVITKVVYTFDDGTTKEVQDKTNHVVQY